MECLSISRIKLLSAFLAITLFGTPVLAQTYSSIITDKEIYDFLNWLTKTEPKYAVEPGIIKQVSEHMSVGIPAILFKRIRLMGMTISTCINPGEALIPCLKRKTAAFYS